VCVFVCVIDCTSCIFIGCKFLSLSRITWLVVLSLLEDTDLSLFNIQINSRTKKKMHLSENLFDLELGLRALDARGRQHILFSTTDAPRRRLGEVMHVFFTAVGMNLL